MLSIIQTLLYKSYKLIKKIYLYLYIIDLRLIIFIVMLVCKIFVIKLIVTLTFSS